MKRKDSGSNSSSRIQDEYYDSNKFADDEFEFFLSFFFSLKFLFFTSEILKICIILKRFTKSEKCHEMTLTKPFIIDKWQSFFILPSITYIHARSLLTTSAFYNFVWKLSNKYKKVIWFMFFFSLLNSYLFFFNFVLFFGPFETMLTLHTVSIDCFFFSRWLMVVCIVIFYLD